MAGRVEENQLRADLSPQEPVEVGVVGRGGAVGVHDCWWQGRRWGNQKGQLGQTADLAPHTVWVEWVTVSVCVCVWERGQANARFILLGESDAKLSCLTESLWREKSCAVLLCMFAYVCVCDARLTLPVSAPSPLGWCHMSGCVGWHVCSLPCDLSLQKINN